jgi:hypothetical protein
MDTDATTVFWFVTLGFTVPGVFLVLAFWSPNRRQVRRWGVACDVTITPENEPVIKAHLGRARRFRSLAAFPFWWMALARALDSDFPSALATPAIGVAAYVIGALVAELTGPLAAPSGARSAALVPRLVGDYRPTWVARLIAGLFGAAAVLVAVRVAFVEAPNGSARSLLTSLVLCAVVVVVAEAAARRIVERPQRGDRADLLAADEGLRAAAVSMTSGASLLAGLGAAGAAAAGAVPEATGWWALLLVPTLLLFQGGAIGVLTLIVRQETWGYRRRYVQVPQAVPA